MPCSRSARRPSVRRERSSAPSRPCRSSSWSPRIALASCSRRPMSVDLPSSTEPAGARRSRSDRATDPKPLPLWPLPLEVAGNLAVLHRGLARALVGEVDRRHLEALLLDVLPDVELGPVRERKHPDVLALADAPVVDAPQLR